MCLQIVLQIVLLSLSFRRKAKCHMPLTRSPGQISAVPPFSHTSPYVQWREREREVEHFQESQKRRASSPPSDDIPFASYALRRRYGALSWSSPTPRLSVIPQGYISSFSLASRGYSYTNNLTASSITSIGSFGRRSPNGLSPSGLSPINPSSPYAAPRSVSAMSPFRCASSSVMDYPLPIGHDTWDFEHSHVEYPWVGQKRSVPSPTSDDIALASEGAEERRRGVVPKLAHTTADYDPARLYFEIIFSQSKSQLHKQPDPYGFVWLVDNEENCHRRKVELGASRLTTCRSPTSHRSKFDTALRLWDYSYSGQRYPTPPEQRYHPASLLASSLWNVGSGCHGAIHTRAPPSSKRSPAKTPRRDYPLCRSQPAGDALAECILSS